MMGEELIAFLCLCQANFAVSVSWNQWNIGPPTVENSGIIWY